jgi:hypothetical protein
MRLSLAGVAALPVALLLTFPAPTAAHDIPSSVAILAYVKPDGERLRLIVRVPLEALRDVKWPLRGPGYLEIGKVDALLRDAARVWIADCVQIFENDTPVANARVVATQVSIPSDRSFESFDGAMAHTLGPPLAAGTDLPWQQAMLDVLFDYPIRSAQSRFSINPALARLGVRTTTVLHFLPSGGSERVFQYSGDPGMVRLDPRWHQAALQFVMLGFRHILDGVDHLLFVFCLVIPVRRLRPLIAIITSFTVAHSITLIASANGLAPSALWFPPLVEMLIALSIVYMACENIVGARLDRRWMLAFGFGLVHGFGFSFALRQSLQFAGTHLLTSLLTFNTGVELGQLLVLLIAMPLLAALYKYVVAERMGTILLSAFVAHTAWHWMTERASTLRRYHVEWPALNAAFAMQLMRGLMLLTILAAALWLLHGLFGRTLRPGTPGETVPMEK